MSAGKIKIFLRASWREPTNIILSSMSSRQERWPPTWNPTVTECIYLHRETSRSEAAWLFDRLSLHLACTGLLGLAAFELA